MTAFELLVAGLSCFGLGFTVAIAYVVWDLRQDRLDREAWARVPGAIDWDAAHTAMLAAQTGVYDREQDA